MLITMKKQKGISQMKGQDKIPEKPLNEVEIGNLPEKEFRIMIVKMIQDLGKMEKMQETRRTKEQRQRLRRCKKYLPKTYKN